MTWADPIPHRQPDGTLTKCVDCSVPFHPRHPIPADQLCRECRDTRELRSVPTLFEVDQ